MKKIISYAASLIITVSAVAAAPTTNIINAFNAAFPNATEVKWNDEKSGYSVSFKQNGDMEKVQYNKKGDFVCSWKYSDGKNIPTNLRMALQKNYKDSQIFGVTEFTNDQGVIIEVKLSQGDNLYSVQASADGKINSEEKIN